MKKYYVNDNAQNSGEHEVHTQDCPFLPLIVSKTDLGMHQSCLGAVIAAKIHYRNVDGCATCCPDCHTK